MRRRRPRSSSGPRFPQDHLHTLPNGLRVAVVELPHLQSAHISVMVKAGPRHETDRTHGLSHFHEHMLFRGCGPLKNTHEMARAAEYFMGSLDGATYRDHVVYGTGFRPDRMAEAVALMGQMMRAPRYEGLSVEKKVLLEEISECFDEKGREIEIDNIARALMFPDSSAGRSIDGIPGVVRRFGSGDLRRHHESFYCGANMVVTIAGPVDAAETMREVQRAFGPLDEGEAARAHDTPVPRQGPTLKFVSHAGSQAQLRMSFAAFGHPDPRAPALQLMRRVLDDGFTTRFQSELVDRRGLAYEMWADVDLFDDCGTVEFGASVTHGKEARTLRAMLHEATRLAKEGPEPGELSRAAERFEWGLMQMHDHAASVAEWYGRSILFDIERRPEKVLAQAQAVRAVDVQSVARDIFRPEHIVVTFVGDVPRAEQPAIKRALERFKAG